MDDDQSASETVAPSKADADSVAARAYDQLPVALATVAGPTHLVTACNAAYRALLSEPSGLVGTALPDRWPEPEGQDLVGLLDHVGRTARPERVAEWCAYLERDGAAAAEVYLDLTATPYLAADGGVAGIHLMLSDATQRVTTRHRAAASPQRARAAGSSPAETVAALQSELLPAALPVLPDADVAASYLLSPEPARAGGDWFDCVVRPDATVALVVGDVVGHGIAAAAVMGQLRAVLNDHLVSGAGLLEAMTRLERCAAQRAETRATTVCVLLLDPTSGIVEYCTAGHPPPLVVTADGAVRYLPLTGCGPLGTGGPLAVRSGQLGLGDVLVLYTDGIMARPGHSHSESVHDLGRVVQQAVPRERSGVRACARATAAVVERARVTGYVDDVVVLAVERVSPPAPFAAAHPAHPDAVGAIRESLARWLEPWEAEVVDVTAVQHAVGELVTNAVEHSGALGPDAVSVRASLGADGVLVCTVADTGRWRAPLSAAGGERWSGHGLAMVRGLVDGLDLSTTVRGTSAVLRHQLHREARLLAGTLPADADVEAAPAPFALEDRGDRLLVSGPLDLTSADDLRILLHRAAHSTTGDLVVDLSGVTHLGSAGVQVLHDLLASAGTVRLSAPAGSPAQQVLEVVQLPCERFAGPRERGYRRPGAP